jgi:rare lipoprotein A
MLQAKWLVALLVLLSFGCGARSSPAPTAGKPARSLQVRQGLASFYGAEFDGKLTASGVRFDMDAMVAAHPDYPFGTLVRVTRVETGRSVTVTIVDRGPARGPRAEGVIIDLSRAAAKALGFTREGRTRVRLDVLRWGGA